MGIRVCQCWKSHQKTPNKSSITTKTWLTSMIISFLCISVMLTITCHHSVSMWWKTSPHHDHNEILKQCEAYWICTLQTFPPIFFSLWYTWTSNHIPRFTYQCDLLNVFIYICTYWCCMASGGWRYLYIELNRKPTTEILYYCCLLFLFVVFNFTCFIYFMEFLHCNWRFSYK